jgi:hypothetical protein
MGYAHTLTTVGVAVTKVEGQSKWAHLEDTVGVEFPDKHRELNRDTLETVAIAMMMVREKDFYVGWSDRLAEATAKKLTLQNFTHPKLLMYIHGAYLAMDQKVL